MNPPPAKTEIVGRFRLTPIGHVVAWIVAIIYLGCAISVFGAAAFSGDETAEQRYWKEKRKGRQQQQANEERRLTVQREEAFAIADEAAVAGAAVQAEMLLLHDGPPPPPAPPGWLEGKRDYVLLGFAAALLAIVAATTLVRHRREAEIRALSGGYLSDGTEVNKFTMPDWFAPQPATPTEHAEDVTMPAVPVLAITTSSKPIPLPGAVAQFFADAPDTLTAIRAALKELATKEEPTARQQTLLQLHVLVTDICRKASCWELRPAWQLSSALELLIKRIADKPKDVTPSALRTVSAAIDLLHELCVPGVRPNLVIDPPIRILAVDDEPLCLRALTFALQKANITPDTATDGSKAVELAKKYTYDVIFLDIQMPEMDGLAACSHIRHIELNDDTPIVFVTALSDFAMRARTIAIGGADFMAKPFLVFEMSVKAMTLLMRKRLQVTKQTHVAVPPPSNVTTPAKPAAKPAPASAAKVEAETPVAV